ncbi:MAG: hypothetical protein QNL61_00485 [Crocinitomicaceae bacterium]
MITRTTLFTGALLSILFVFSTTSCKKCKLSEGNQNNGLIVKDVIIYPQSGYLTSNLGATMHITGSHAYADQFEVSFDGGATRVPVNYGQYSILSNAVSVPCEASLNRDVSYNSALDFYIYDLSGETCKGCNTERLLENYVLVPAIPNGTQIVFEQNVVAK